MNKPAVLLAMRSNFTEDTFDALIRDQHGQPYLAKGCSLQTPDIAKLTVAKFSLSFVYDELVELTEDEMNNWRMDFLGLNH